MIQEKREQQITLPFPFIFTTEESTPWELSVVMHPGKPAMHVF